MEFNKEKAEAVLKLLQKAKWEVGLHESAALISAYKWIQEFLEYHESKPSPKVKRVNRKKAISNGDN